jgi:hypothetical protein
MTKIHVVRETLIAMRIDGESADDEVFHLRGVQRFYDGFNAADFHLIF